LGVKSARDDDHPDKEYSQDEALDEAIPIREGRQGGHYHEDKRYHRCCDGVSAEVSPSWVPSKPWKCENRCEHHGEDGHSSRNHMWDVRVSRVCEVERSKRDAHITNPGDDQCYRPPPEARGKPSLETEGEYYDKDGKDEDDDGHN